jgi:hypothetical protein
MVNFLPQKKLKNGFHLLPAAHFHAGQTPRQHADASP